MEYCCRTCEAWYTDERIQRKYGEGEGHCSEREEITFCEKHNCMLYKQKEEEK